MGRGSRFFEPFAHPVEESTAFDSQGNSLFEPHGKLRDTEACAAFWSGQHEWNTLQNRAAHMLVGDHMTRVQHVNPKEILCNLGYAIMNKFCFGSAANLINEQTDTAVGAGFGDDFNSGVGVSNGGGLGGSDDQDMVGGAGKG